MTAFDYRSAIDDEQDRLSCAISTRLTLEQAIAMLGSSDYPGAKTNAHHLDDILGDLVEMVGSLLRARKHRAMKKVERELLDICSPGWETEYPDHQDPDWEDAA